MRKEAVVKESREGEKKSKRKKRVCRSKRGRLGAQTKCRRTEESGFVKGANGRRARRGSKKRERSHVQNMNIENVRLK